jgi:hypothetical protein
MMPVPDQQMFAAVDLNAGWEKRPGRQGVVQQVLHGRLESRSGHCTRLVKFEPMAKAPASQHDHWEEIYLISGDLSLTDEEGKAIARFDAPAFVCRGPGEMHGPFASEAGCLMLQIEYYVRDEGLKG